MTGCLHQRHGREVRRQRHERAVDVRGLLVDDLLVRHSSDLYAIESAVVAFFAEHELASLRLPAGWFGRPQDNWHHLTATEIAGDALQVRLDGNQVLALDVERASSEARVLRVRIRGGRWRWTEYGADIEHNEVLEAGTVEFHAPIRF